MEPVRIAIVGASGYTGAELLRLLSSHPSVRLTALAAKERLAPSVADVLPHLRGVLELPIERFDPDAIAQRADAVFCALPHGASIEAVQALRQRGLWVLDLSADFRLRDPDVYKTWYGNTHGAPELLREAVYGLPELHREALRGAKLIAVPGCYPTASTLPVLPLLAAGLVRADDIIVHALSGVSGGGRTPAPSFHFSETAEGVRAYKVAGTHRHTPEIEQVLADVAKQPVRVTFTPTLLPMTRGILSTVYLRPAHASVRLEDCVRAAETYFKGSCSVAVLPAGQLPDTLWVRGSNRAHVAYAWDARTERVLAFGALDNLVKGASGQAIQCLNIALGLEEGAGLMGAATWP